MLSDLLFQPFYWPTFSHWITNSANCGAHLIQKKQGTAVLFASQKLWQMSAMVPDSAIELTGFSVYRSDRTNELTGKSRGGGVCFYINNSWCNERNIHSIKSFCSPDLEFHTLLCRPFWLPRNLQRSQSRLFTFLLKPTQTRHSGNCTEYK